MSKSYDNTLELFGDEKELKKRIMRIVTDSTPLEDPKNPDTCNLFALYKLLVSDTEREEMATRYREGGLGYGEVKKALHERVISVFEPFRQKRRELEANMDAVHQILRDGAEKAESVISKTVKSVRDAIGISG